MAKGLVTSEKVKVKIATAREERLGGAFLGAVEVMGHRFADADVTFEAAGKKTVNVTVPRLTGMTEIVVNRAQFSLTPVATELPAVSGAASTASASHSVSLSGSVAKVASVVRVVVNELALASGSVPSYLSNASGSSTVVFAGDGSAGTRDGDSTDHRKLHVLLRPRTASGSSGAPARAVPSFPMPGQNNDLYGAMLGGMDAAFDSPSKGAIAFSVNPPLEATSVDVFLGILNFDDTANRGPNDLTSVNWTGASLNAVFSVVPQDLAITCSGGGQTPPVASFPGPLPARRSDVDFSPAARAVLNAANRQSGAGDLSLTLELQSKTAGRLHVTSIAVDAFYRFAAVGKDGSAVSLRGGRTKVPLALPGPYRAASLDLTLDGSFGPGVVVANADREQAGAYGFSLGGDVFVARRLPLESSERGLQLLRVGVFGRAVEDTSLLFEVHAGDENHIDRLLAPPVSVKLVRSRDPAWQRVELASDPSVLPNPSTVWVVVRAERGAFLWYGDRTATGMTQTSSDAGRTWTKTDGRPYLQMHKLTNTTELSPIELWIGEERVTSDLLKLPAATTRLDVPRFDAARIQKNTEKGNGATFTASSSSPSAASFRLEGLAPLGAPWLSKLATLSGSLPVSFDCRRDADFKILDASFTYDPWSAKVS